MASLSDQSNESKSRENAWAQPVTRLTVSDVPAGAININVNGRHMVGPLQGFGQMWQKTYRVRLSGSQVVPTEVIRVWKENFPNFWPRGNNFYTPLTNITPGEVAILNLTLPGGMPLSTGVRVIYADDESFTFMTPEGHMFAAMITFSAYDEDRITVAQVQPLMRANDPLYEMAMRLGLAHKMEDQFWHATLKSLASHFGVDGQIQQRNTLVDPRVQWREAKNIWHNAAVRSGIYAVVAPLRWARHLFTH